MPRRRHARKAPYKRKPQVPDGDEGNDLAVDVKREKLKTLIADLATHMDSWFESIEDTCNDIEKSIECTYIMALTKLPKCIREMDLNDYIKSGGEVTPAHVLDTFSKELEMSLGTNIALSTLTKPRKTAKRKGKKATPAVNSKGTIQPQQWKSTNNNTSVNMPPPRTIRNACKRNKLETPAQRGDPSQYGWETPLITPKFDPRLPVTPAMMRPPKAGEVVLSLAGSPIANECDRNTLIIKKDTTRDKTFLVLNDEEFDLENLEIPNMETSAKEYLLNLKQKLNALRLSPP